MIIMLLLILICVYLVIRQYLPVFVIMGSKESQFKLLDDTTIYQVVSNSKEKIVIPTGQWREISTGITIAPFGVFKIGKHIIYPFGRIGCRIYPMSDLKLKGLDITPTVYTGIPRKEIIVIGTNWNPRQPFVIREGMPIAFVELYRIPTFTLWEIWK